MDQAEQLRNIIKKQNMQQHLALRDHSDEWQRWRR